MVQEDPYDEYDETERELRRIDNMKTILLHIVSSISASNESASAKTCDSLLDNLSDLLLLLKEDTKQQQVVIFCSFCQLNGISCCILPIISHSNTLVQLKVVEILYVLSIFINPLHKSNVSDPLNVAQYLQQIKREIGKKEILRCILYLIKDLLIEATKSESHIPQPITKLSMIISMLSNFLCVGDWYQFSCGNVECKGLQNDFLLSMEESLLFEFVVFLFPSIEQFGLEPCIPYLISFLLAIFSGKNFDFFFSSLDKVISRKPTSNRNSKLIGTFDLLNESLSKSKISYSSSTSAFDSEKSKKSSRRKKILFTLNNRFGLLSSHCKSNLVHFACNFAKFSLNSFVNHTAKFMNNSQLSSDICKIFNLVMKISLKEDVFSLHNSTFTDANSLNTTSNQVLLNNGNEFESPFAMSYSLIQKNYINSILDSLYSNMNENRLDSVFAMLKLLDVIFDLILTIGSFYKITSELEMAKYYSWFFCENVEFRKLLRSLNAFKSLQLSDKGVICDLIYKFLLFTCFNSTNSFDFSIYQSIDGKWPENVILSATSFLHENFIFDLLNVLFTVNGNYVSSAFGLLSMYYQNEQSRKMFCKISCVKLIQKEMPSIHDKKIKEFSLKIIESFTDYMKTECKFGIDVFFIDFQKHIHLPLEQSDSDSETFMDFANEESTCEINGNINHSDSNDTIAGISEDNDEHNENFGNQFLISKNIINDDDTLE